MIEKFLSCSTVYLPPAFRQRLWDGEAAVTQVGEDEHHRWVYVDDGLLDGEPMVDSPLPAAMIALIRHALDHGVCYICFDPDGPEDLPETFERFPYDTESEKILADAGFEEHGLGGNLVGWVKGGSLITLGDGDRPSENDEAFANWVVGPWPIQQESLHVINVRLARAIEIASLHA